MARFHINGKGEPTACNATVRACPLGGEHFESMEEASIASMRFEFAQHSGPSWEEGQVVVGSLSRDMMRGGEAILPPGRYFFGDPCYSAGRDDTAWQQWVEVATRDSNNFVQTVVGGTYNGLPVVASQTAYGDGTYAGSDGNEYPVDAGLIGVVPEEVVRGLGLTDTDLRCSGSWVEVDEPTSLRFDEGFISFGPVVVSTGDEEGDEDEDNYCERCGDLLDNHYDSLCVDCEAEEAEED